MGISLEIMALYGTMPTVRCLKRPWIKYIKHNLIQPIEPTILTIRHYGLSLFVKTSWPELIANTYILRGNIILETSGFGGTLFWKL